LQMVSEEIERYALEHTTSQPEQMSALHERASQTLAFPQMLSGPLVGRLLELLVHSVQAKLVLEIGTYAGYSTLAMAAGLPADGRIVTCELDPAHAEFASGEIAASPHSERIELIVGPALETISKLDGRFDFVFIDAEKTGYGAYYEAVIDRLSPHGLIAADNTLYGGEALQPKGDSARAIAAFNERVAADPRASAVMLTVRDGITLIRRR
jgi:caffeoyl-CoA O-methyltransferase